jgi:hypothetical protein
MKPLLMLMIPHLIEIGREIDNDEDEEKMKMLLKCAKIIISSTKFT